MAACDEQANEGDGSRRRKAHKKSRQGCRNCKIRRVKCDETMPNCMKCASFGVSCNYGSKAADLEISFAGTAIIKEVERPLDPFLAANLGFAEVPAPLSPLICVRNDPNFKLDSLSMDRLFRFQTRTVLTIGNRTVSRLLQNAVSKLALEHPCLMHVIQTVTAIHDRYLLEPPNSRRTTTEVYHWFRAAALLNEKLSAPIQPSDRDALWGTASIMGIITCSSFEGASPEDAWPLKPPDPSDLGWIRMAHGKSAIWDATDPLRPDSLFSSLGGTCGGGYFPSVHKVCIEHVPSAFVQLCGLTESSTKENNPYHDPVQSLTALLYIDCDRSTLMEFFSWISIIRSHFKLLLENKDPRALLLLAYWFAKVCRAMWWVERRAVLECQATCIYLERHCADDKAIMDLLQFPKIRCGLLE